MLIVDDPTQLTEKRVAEITTLSLSTLRRMRANPLLGGPPWAKQGHRVFYPKADLLRWLTTRLRRSTSDAAE